MTAPPPAEPDSGERTGEAPIDFDAALRATDGDTDLLGELAEIFVGECPRQREDLRRAVEAGQAEGVQRAAHTLQGALAAIGGTPACRLAQELETMGAAPRLEGAPDTLGRLERELDRLTVFLSTPGWTDRR